MKKQLQLFITIYMMAISSLLAQERFNRSLEGIKKIHIKVINSNVQLIAGNENELIITKGDEQNSENSNNRNFTIGNDNNNGYGISIKNKNKTLMLKDIKPFTNRAYDLVFIIPKDMKVFLECERGESVKIDGFSSEIEVYAHTGNISAKNITGPLIANTNSGAVDIAFKKLSQNNDSSINSETGTINVSLPRDTNANLELSSFMGEIKTDLDLDISREQQPKKNKTLSEIECKLNEGGVKLGIESSIGNIFLKSSN